MIREKHKLELRSTINTYTAQIKDTQDKNYELMTTNMNLKRINNEYQRKIDRKNQESEELKNQKFKIKELKDQIQLV